MAAIVPSFVAKLNRAEQHLIDLKAAIKEYGGSDTDPATRPYTVRARVESKRKRRTVHRLHFTRAVENTDVPLIAADAIYNLRSSLEHLMAALVPAKDRDSVTFPIIWRGVWEPLVEGENAKRRKDREKWQTITRRVRHVDAVTFLKRLQPPDEARDEETPHALRLLNQLSNTDRHSKLPVVAHGMKGLLISWRRPDGSKVAGFAHADPDSVFEDQAEIRPVPKGAVYVESFGVPDVVIRSGLTGDDGRAINLPVIEFVDNTLDFLRSTVVPGLTPYVHRPGGRKRK